MEIKPIHSGCYASAESYDKIVVFFSAFIFLPGHVKLIVYHVQKIVVERKFPRSNK